MHLEIQKFTEQRFSMNLSLLSLSLLVLHFSVLPVLMAKPLDGTKLSISIVLILKLHEMYVIV